MEGIMQPHMVTCGSFNHCASLTKHDEYVLIRQIWEILPIPQEITEKLKSESNNYGKEAGLPRTTKTNRSSNPLLSLLKRLGP